MVLKRFITVLAVTLPLCWCALSQEVPQGEKDFGRRLERVRELYGNDMYQAARAGIDDIFQQCSVPAAVEPELAAYRIVCDIRLGSPNVDALMDEYREKYRHAPEYMGVRLLYAGYYFDRKDYVRALEILETVEYPLLSRKDRTKFLFQRCDGMAQTRLGDAQQLCGSSVMLDFGKFKKIFQICKIHNHSPHSPPMKLSVSIIKSADTPCNTNTQKE